MLLLILSLFNTFLPLWLGLTVLLNAERRAWGVWLAGAGLIGAGIFFAAHTLLLFFQLPTWGWLSYAGRSAVTLLPLAWYVAMLWFAGFWDILSMQPAQRNGNLRIHQWGLPFSGLLVVVVLVALALSDSVSSAASWQGSSNYSANPSSMIPQYGLPVRAVLYPGFLLICFGLSLHALRNLQPSGRVMGDIARRRARPWLVAVTWLQIGISLIVGVAIFWLATNRNHPPGTFTPLLALERFDLAVSFLISISILLLGQAIVSYEIFTGKTLPRQGFRRQWQKAIAVAAGTSILLAVMISLKLPAVWFALATVMLIGLFYALLNWRTYIERDRFLEQVRLFATGERIFEQLTATANRPANSTKTFADETTTAEAVRSLNALCRGVLGARDARLFPMGTLATLIGWEIGGEGSANGRTLSNLLTTMPELSSAELCVGLDPQQFNGAVWGIPLRGNQGLIGALLLWEKQDGGLYTREEMELAQASGERLIDMLAGTELARRLVLLQRQRIAETQVMDARTRRILHDDVLPQLHALALATSASPDSSELLHGLTNLHRDLSDLLHQLPTPTLPDLERLGLIGLLRRVVELELHDAFDELIWNVDARAEQALQELQPLTAEVVWYAAREAARNAAKYGRGTSLDRPLRLTISATAQPLAIIIEDNGVGIAASQPTSHLHSGHGQALHGTMMAVVGGGMIVESEAGTFTRVTLMVSC